MQTLGFRGSFRQAVVISAAISSEEHLIEGIEHFHFFLTRLTLGEVHVSSKMVLFEQFGNNVTVSLLGTTHSRLEIFSEWNACKNRYLISKAVSYVQAPSTVYKYRDHDCASQRLAEHPRLVPTCKQAWLIA